MNKNLEHWRELYHLAKELKKRQPWEYLSDNDLISIDIENRETPILISILGAEGACYGITVHPTIKSVKALFTLFQEDRFVVDPLSTPMSSQEALTLYFGDRDEISKGQYKVIKDLGLKFRGHNNWIFFKSLSIGEIPRDLKDKEVVLLSLIYKKLILVIDYISKGISFKKNELISVYRLVNDNKLETVDFFEVYPTMKEDKIKAIPYKNDLMLHKLKQYKINEDRIEITYIYPEVSEDQIHFIPLLIGISHQSGAPIIVEFIKNKEELYETIFQTINEYILEYGRPRAIHVRLEDLTQQLADYCQKLGIMLIDDPDLNQTSQFIIPLLNKNFRSF